MVALVNLSSCPNKPSGFRYMVVELDSESAACTERLVLLMDWLLQGPPKPPRQQAFFSCFFFLNTLKQKGLTAEKKTDYAASSNNKCCVCSTQRLKKCHNLLKASALIQTVWKMFGLLLLLCLFFFFHSSLPLTFILTVGKFHKEGTMTLIFASSK